MQNEGLVPFRNGYANEIYPLGEFWDGAGGFDASNYQNVFHKIANGINVPKAGLALNSLEDCYKAYKACAPLGAVINRIAEALMNGKIKIVNSLDEDVSKSTSKNEKIVSLLRRPNPLQTMADFLKQVAKYRATYGAAFIYAAVPAGFTKLTDAINLWVFSPLEVDVRYKDSIYLAQKPSDLIEKYVITPKVSVKSFEAEAWQVLPIFDTSEETLSVTGKPDGVRIKSLYYDIRNILQGQEAIYSLNSDRGAQGIISNEAKDALGFVPMTLEEKQNLQNRFKSKYGLRRDQDKVYVTDASVKYTPIGFNVKDLMLHEGLRSNVMAICDQYNYPFDLLSSEKGKTAADKRTAMSGLYQDNIIPLADDISAKLTLFFGMDVDNELIIIDYSHLQIFQTGNVERNNALRQLIQALHITYNGDVITREEFRRTAGYAAEIPKNGTLKSSTNAPKERDDIRITTS